MIEFGQTQMQVGASRQAPDEVERARFWEMNDQIIRAIPCALVIMCPVADVIPYGIVTASKPFLTA